MGGGKHGAEEGRDRRQGQGRDWRQEQGTLQASPELGRVGQESARVANSSAKTSRKRTSQRSGAISSFANLKVPELRRRAKKAGIKSRSTMNKKQLIKALRAA
jgi:hypothetical protein